MGQVKNLVTIQSVFGIRDVDEHAAILKKLDEGIHVDAIDSGGRTLLMEAVIRRDHELIDILIMRGANVNVRDGRNWTALHFAAQEYDFVSVKKLLSSGADVNAQDDSGNGVLSRATYNARGRGEVIEYLLANGADPDLKNKSGISARDLAKNISNFDVAVFFPVKEGNRGGGR